MNNIKSHLSLTRSTRSYKDWFGFKESALSTLRNEFLFTQFEHYEMTSLISCKALKSGLEFYCIFLPKDIFVWLGSVELLEYITRNKIEDHTAMHVYPSFVWFVCFWAQSAQSTVSSFIISGYVLRRDDKKRW